MIRRVLLLLALMVILAGCAMTPEPYDPHTVEDIDAEQDTED